MLLLSCGGGGGAAEKVATCLGDKGRTRRNEATLYRRAHLEEEDIILLLLIPEVRSRYEYIKYLQSNNTRV
jgi:hypothetical protein